MATLVNSLEQAEKKCRTSSSTYLKQRKQRNPAAEVIPEAKGVKTSRPSSSIRLGPCSFEIIVQSSGH